MKKNIIILVSVVVFGIGISILILEYEKSPERAYQRDFLIHCIESGKTAWNCGILYDLKKQQMQKGDK